MAKLKIDKLTADPRLQHRQDAKDFPGCANPELAAEYAEAIKAGAKFPPVKAVHDKEARAYWLFDGFHTVAASDKAGKPQVEAEVVEGTFDDALRLSWGSNSTHGARRNGADMANVLRSLFAADPKMIRRPLRELTALTHISPGYISRIRTEVAEEFAAKKEMQPEAAVPVSEGENGDGAQAAAPAEKRGRGRPPGPGKRRKAGKGKDKSQDNGHHGGTPADNSKPLKDEEGSPVPDDLRYVFLTVGPSLTRIMDRLNECRDDLHAVEEAAPWVAHARAKEAAEAWLSAIAGGLPYAVCPACKGERCERCRQTGYAPEAHYHDLQRELETVGAR
jgi:hypothetical protein